MLQKVSAIKSQCELWGISDETSAYVQAAVRHASQVCRDQMDRVPEMRRYMLDELLPWNGWPPGEFKSEVSRTVLHPAASKVAEVRESVTRFVLNDPRLGDPRLPHNRLNWSGVGGAERVIEWLSQLDIVFFFESVLPKGKDPHGRKAFWLRYVSRVVRSRPLLNWDDRSRLQAVLKQKGHNVAHFGSMDGPTSAFLLDFGSLLAIEFSVVNNACYFYRKNDIEKIMPDFWTSRPVIWTSLKERGLCVSWVVHRKSKSAWHGGGWEEKATNILAQFGIRQGA